MIHINGEQRKILFDTNAEAFTPFHGSRPRLVRRLCGRAGMRMTLDWMFA